MWRYIIARTNIYELVISLPPPIKVWRKDLNYTHENKKVDIQVGLNCTGCDNSQGNGLQQFFPPLCQIKVNTKALTIDMTLEIEKFINREFPVALLMFKMI